MLRFAAAVFACLPAFAADADLILHSARILTLNPKQAEASAVAIRGGRITHLGASADVLKSERGPRTVVRDAGGRMIVPGLIDSHVHVLEAGLSEFREPLPRIDSFESVRAYLRRKASVTPKGEWIVVPKTFPTRLREQRMPTKELLDVLREHPVMFDASYVVITNTAGLERSGITRNTPNPARGEIVHGPDGEPNGILKNAKYLLKGLAADAVFSEAEKLQAMEEMLRRYAAAGFSSVVDGGADAEEIALFRKLRASGRLPVRVALNWWHDVTRPAPDIVREIRAADFTTNSGDEWLKFSALKVNVDGGMTIGTAYQRVPYGAFGKQLYGKTDPDDRGQLFETPRVLFDIMSAAREKGWQMTAHTQGGGAIDGFLDAMQAIDAKLPVRETRSHLIHASFQGEDSLRRMAGLGVLADVQAPWLYFDAPVLAKVFAPETIRFFFPLRAYLDAGIVVAGGSDHMIGHDADTAMNPYNPFFNIWVAVTRKTAAGTVFHPEQRVSREEALRMYTTGGAYRQFEEKQKGTIEEGKLADLVVLDRDYLKCPEDEIRQIRPLLTVIGGRIAFDRLSGPR